MEVTDEWEALIAESKELHKTLKRTTDISCILLLIILT